MTRIYVIVAIVLVLSGVGFFVTRSLVDTGRKEVQIETLTEQIQIRREIDEAVRDTPPGRDGAIGVLRDFIGSRD